MSRLKRLVNGIAFFIVVSLVGMFALSAAVNGFDEAVDLAFSTPRNLFCSVMPFCESEGAETEIVDEREIWTRMHDRAILETRKYETHREWKAEQTTLVTQSVRMEATLHITMGVNLWLIGPEDIVVDNDTETVTITLPQAQYIECFLTDVEYQESCLLICDDLKKDVREKALDNALKSDDVALALNDAYELAKPIIASLLDPVTNDYTINFVQNPEAPEPIQGSSCY